MVGITLEHAYEKLRWAKHHFELLRPEIESFEKRNTHRFSVKVDPDKGKYTFSVHDLNDVIDPDWGLIVGDCVHNARTALDYLAVRIWALVSGRRPEDIDDVQFPIYGAMFEDASDVDIEKATTRAIGSLKSKTSKFAKEPLFSGYLTTMEQLQPFNCSNPSIWGMAGAVFPDEFTPKGFTRVSGSYPMKALENDAEIGFWEFETPLPTEWEPTQMDMRRCFPIHVALGAHRPFNGLLEILPLCLWGVEAVLAIFAPVFRFPQEPPLPVTAIVPPGPETRVIHSPP